MARSLRSNAVTDLERRLTAENERLRREAQTARAGRDLLQQRLRDLCETFGPTDDPGAAYLATLREMVRAEKATQRGTLGVTQ